MSGTMAGDYNQNQNATLGNGMLQQFAAQPGAIVHIPAQAQAQWVAPLNQQLVQALQHAYEPPVPAYDNLASFRALRLLWKHLTPEQRAQYKLFARDIDHEGHSFIVRGNATGMHYRIFEAGSVLRLKDQHRFCLVLTGEPVPTADMMLAKKLLLENDEHLFLYTANDLSDHHGQVQAHADLLNQQMREVLTTTGRRGRAFLNRVRLRQW